MTGPGARHPRGRLQVTVDYKSHWLSQNLPYVVRDASNAFITEGTVGDGGVVELDEGYYTVEAITPSGAPSRQVVHVSADETYPLVINDREVGPGDGPAPQPSPPMQPASPVLEDSPAPIAEVESTENTRPPAGLDGFWHCTATEGRDGWTFSPDRDLRDVPTARFLLYDPRAWLISLPLNPQGTAAELRECHVRIERPAIGPAHPVATFSRQRRVSRMLDGILRHNEVMSANLVDKAAELLLSKYSDAPAAALGGLTLHRFGRLKERQAWVENLARDFTWLPDGQILCAALLIHDEDRRERARGLDLLFSATASRPLYTDGLSLASELLRRWPGDDWADKRKERLGRLSDYACTTDWNAVMLTTRDGW